uniref:RING-type E3 ubiquitin transferase n=1 Tax=Culicoides sonorensis TaxID=179676 RepID=A0A336MIV3_CULSO
MSLFLSKAGQAEIIRSAQKDNQFIDEIYLTVSELLRRYSQNLWIKFDTHIKTLTNIFYYSFHSILGIQTLGEEYTGVIQIDQNYKSLPSRLLQVICYVLEFAGESALRRAISVIKVNVQKNNDLLPNAKRVIIRFFETLLDFIPFIQSIHRGLFYLNGNKYHISKRFTGINYVLVRYWLKQDHSVYGYKILGIITLIQAFMSITFYLKRQFEKNQENTRNCNLVDSQNTTDEVIRSGSGKICVLCMDVRTNASAIRCGHIFCYDCIMDWIETKNECPICREPTKPSNVMFLMNYE